MKMESGIHNTSFLISPTTHLFPLAGQSGSRGVSSMINFELKIWNNAKYYPLEKISTQNGPPKMN